MQQYFPELIQNIPGKQQSPCGLHNKQDNTDQCRVQREKIRLQNQNPLSVTNRDVFLPDVAAVRVRFHS